MSDKQSSLRIICFLVNWSIGVPYIMRRTQGGRYSRFINLSSGHHTPAPASDPALIKKARESDFHHSAGIMASRGELQQGTGTIESRKTYARFGDKYWERWTRSYPEIVRKHHPEMIEPSWLNLKFKSVPPLCDHIISIFKAPSRIFNKIPPNVPLL